MVKLHEFTKSSMFCLSSCTTKQLRKLLRTLNIAHGTSGENGLVLNVDLKIDATEVHSSDLTSNQERIGNMLRWTEVTDRL